MTSIVCSVDPDVLDQAGKGRDRHRDLEDQAGERDFLRPELLRMIGAERRVSPSPVLDRVDATGTEQREEFVERVAEWARRSASSRRRRDRASSGAESFRRRSLEAEAGLTGRRRRDAQIFCCASVLIDVVLERRRLRRRTIQGDEAGRDGRARRARRCYRPRRCRARSMLRGSSSATSSA